MRRILFPVIRIFFAISLSLVIAEGVLRLAFDEVNFLAPELEADPILGRRIKPNSAGHDDWGYRNRTVPSSADIVAIGDSQTYGVSALADQSWPAWLSRILARPVYNLALGGYSPIHYRYVLEDRALNLRPDIVLVGFYLGNDLSEAFSLVYSLDYWQFLRTTELTDQIDQPIEAPVNLPSGAVFRLKRYFGHNSILYRAMTEIVGDKYRYVESRYFADSEELVWLQTGQVKTAFTPRKRLNAVNLTDLRIQEGQRLSLEAIYRMYQLCQRQGVRLIVVLIPTKESVYASELKNQIESPHYESLRSLIAFESEIASTSMDFFRDHEIEVVDILPALRDAARHRQIYPSNEDGHFISEGYRAIANRVAEHIQTTNYSRTQTE